MRKINDQTLGEQVLISSSASLTSSAK